MAFTLAVVSDVHVHRRVEPATWDLTTRVFKSAANANHVLVAGDLFDSAGAFAHDAEAVRRLLRRLGLWTPERLSIVPGNHDLFATPHRGAPAQRLAEFAEVLMAGANETYRAFSEWVSDLVPRDGRYWSDDLFPFRKRLDGCCILIGADSTPRTTWEAAGGSWPADDDRAVRELLDGEDGLRVLGLHHPPEEAPETTLREQLVGAAFGFQRRDLKRLERLADSMELDVILCGHVHDNAGDPWSWRFGRRTAVHMMGRSGGLHGARPCIGELQLPRRGAPRWCTIRA